MIQLRVGKIKLWSVLPEDYTTIESANGDLVYALIPGTHDKAKEFANLIIEKVLSELK